MARRRRFYARDTHGRFARTAGAKGVYKKKMSTKRKVAIAGAGAVAVGAVAVGGREAYRAGARKGWEVGKRQGIYEGKPLRGKRGKFMPNSVKHDTSQNPFARGYRPVGPMGRARKPPKMRTARDRYRQWEKRQEGTSPRTQSRRMHKATRAAGINRAKAAERSRARRYDRAQKMSQARTAASTRVRRSAANAVVAGGIAGTVAGRKVSSRRRKR